VRGARPVKLNCAARPSPRNFPRRRRAQPVRSRRPTQVVLPPLIAQRATSRKSSWSTESETAKVGSLQKEPRRESSRMRTTS